MAKKEKTIEQYRKSYKRRGIFYAVMVILLLIATIVTSFDAVEKGIYVAVFPKHLTVPIEGKDQIVYAKIEKKDGIEYASYYYLDGNGKKIDLPSYKYTDSKGATHNNSLTFKSTAKLIVSIIMRLIRALLVLFIILLIIYLVRFSYYLSNKDEEWNNKAGDMMFKIRRKFDKPRNPKEKK